MNMPMHWLAKENTDHQIIQTQITQTQLSHLFRGSGTYQTLNAYTVANYYKYNQVI